MHTDWWIGDADTLTLLKQLKNNGNKLQISKCLFRVLLCNKEKRKLSLNSKLSRADWWFQ